MPTTISIVIGNTGAAINKLEIRDSIANETRYGPKFFAANDGDVVNGFSVRDASHLVADIEILHDDVSKYNLQDVVDSSTVDVWTGRVTSP